jgi:hypothetical protein
MFFALSMLMDGVTNASLSLNSIYSEDARINAHTCIEDVLRRMKLEQQFNRNLNYTISPLNTCSTALQWFEEHTVAPGLHERLVNVDATGVSHGFTRTLRYELRVTRYDIPRNDGTSGNMNAIDFISVNELNN